MQQGVTGNLTPYVTSSFQEHSLTATTSVMSSLLGGLVKLPLAKLLDVVGKPRGFAAFYWVGYNGLAYTMSIFIADSSALRDRALMLAYASSPYIITMWLAGPIANSVLATIGYNWGFGIFAIVTPIITLPLFFLLMQNYYSANKGGHILEPAGGRQSVVSYLPMFDVVGLILVLAGFVLILLPLIMYAMQAEGWEPPKIIIMIIVGGLLLVVFALWERFVASFHFMPWEVLIGPGTSALSIVLFVSYHIWNSYFSSFLQGCGSCVGSIVVGVAIWYTSRFKWLAVYFGVPVAILGVGLMIQFRQPDAYIGHIIMCQICIACAGGTLVICEQMAAVAVVEQRHIAAVLAVDGMFSSVGGAIGSTVAAVVWQGVFPVKLKEYLPAAHQQDFDSIYGSLTVQKSFPVGSEARNAINRAYGDAHKNLLIVATAVLALGIPATVAWKNIKLKTVQQT
ncbi:MFS siderochrome iron transporter 1 [Colletotrichum orbiculare MAFF 240422]|uniref:MFS siderochrome iron transporter 1 n=1 Tax=Colletotrichum orbiculare (strain 104-T / ATCC 96160 / CBS 514.97 / LARS 414 / MAFF 240422) TaxID=1213857 RepID=A0A484G5F0_COLOR|nr:MFS siderochrome iron transporter 1 [Colletotrichum orbiculare MAFF 240422]